MNEVKLSRLVELTLDIKDVKGLIRTYNLRRLSLTKTP